MSDDEMRDEFRQLAMRMNDSAFQSWVGMLERTKDPKGAVFQRAINLRDETRNDKPLRVPALNELN
jgi:hypothetical protein